MFQRSIHPKGFTTMPENPATKGGCKFELVELIDEETGKLKISDLTIEEARDLAADIAARLAGLRRRWEASGDVEALLGALIFYRHQRLPEQLFNGLMHNVGQKPRNPHEICFLAVRHAHLRCGG
jgi:hypothetical protein